MFSIAYRVVGSVSEAEDIVQDDGPARQRYLGRGRPGYQLDARLLRTMATDMLTIRIELDP
jgi:hypothetical protein